MTDADLLHTAAADIGEAVEALRRARRRLEQAGCERWVGRLQTTLIGITDLDEQVGAEARRRHSPAADAG